MEKASKPKMTLEQSSVDTILFKPKFGVLVLTFTKRATKEFLKNDGTGADLILFLRDVSNEIPTATFLCGKERVPARMCVSFAYEQSAKTNDITIALSYMVYGSEINVMSDIFHLTRARIDEAVEDAKHTGVMKLLFCS